MTKKQPHGQQRWLFGVMGGVLSLVVTVYIMHFIFLLLLKSDPWQANVFVAMNHWQQGIHDPLYAKKLKLSLVGSLGLVYGLPLMLWLSARTKRSLHGAARFANQREIKQSGLMANNGIIVGRYKDHYLHFPGQQFVLLSAPTRSGKGVGIVIPNLLSFNDSVVVLDIKQENFNVTAGFRQQHGQAVYLFNPFAEDRRTHRYNPLGYINQDPHFRVGDILAIGYVFFPGGGKDAFFDDQARNLFLGLTLYLCETPELPLTMGELLRVSSGNGKPIKTYLTQIMQQREKSTQPLSHDCVNALNRFISTSDNTLSSILASFNAPLVNWANPIVDAATSANDFDLREVRKKKMTIYIGITPDHLAEAALLVNCLFAQLINLNTKELPQANPTLKHTCLLLMDEFTAMGKVGILAKAVSYMAGYNLRLLPIIQSISQLVATYGQDDARTFMTNHALQIIYAPREQKDANEYSDMLGYETVKSKSHSRQKGKGQHSESVSDQRRALLLPQELKELGQWKEIILLENCKPILCDKISYFDDPIFIQRLCSPPDIQRLNLDEHLRHTHKGQSMRMHAHGMDEPCEEDTPDISVKAILLKEVAQANTENQAALVGLVDTYFDNLDDDGSYTVPESP